MRELINAIYAEPFLIRFGIIFVAIWALIIGASYGFLLFAWISIRVENFIHEYKEKRSLDKPQLVMEVRASVPMRMQVNGRYGYMCGGDRIVIKKGNKVYFSGMVSGVRGGPAMDEYDIYIIEDLVKQKS